MCLDGVFGNEELRGDLTIAQAAGDEVEDLELALRERAERTAAASAGEVHDAARDARAQVGPAFGDGPKRTQQLVRGGGLRDEAVGAYADRAPDAALVVVHRQEDDPDVGMRAAELRRHLEAVLAGDLDVEQNDVGGHGLHERRHLVAASGLADNVESGLGGDRLHEALPHEHVVLDNRNLRLGSKCGGVPPHAPRALHGADAGIHADSSSTSMS